MAYEEKLETITMIANADYSAAANQYKFVVTNTTAKNVVVNTTAGADAFGVLQDTPGAGQAACVGIGGVTKVQAGASFSAGVQLMSDNTGRAVLATSTNRILGTALAASGAAGEIVPMKFDKNGVV